jgi:ribosomal protein S18 acetylase RimI-like enzyme
MDSAASSSAPLQEIQIRLAILDDVETLVRLINAAFVVERFVFDGDRVDATGVRRHMNSGKFLLAEDVSEPVGCVYVEIRGKHGYVGLLSVAPQRQGTGLGRKLMDAAEEYFYGAGCVCVDLRVISQRTPLPAFYRHLGYAETGTASFPDDAHAKISGHFILMSQPLVSFHFPTVVLARENGNNSGSYFWSLGPK